MVLFRNLGVFLQSRGGADSCLGLWLVLSVKRDGIFFFSSRNFVISPEETLLFSSAKKTYLVLTSAGVVFPVSSFEFRDFFAFLANGSPFVIIFSKGLFASSLDLFSGIAPFIVSVDSLEGFFLLGSVGVSIWDCESRFTGSMFLFLVAFGARVVRFFSVDNRLLISGVTITLVGFDCRGTPSPFILVLTFLVMVANFSRESELFRSFLVCSRRFALALSSCCNVGLPSLVSAFTFSCLNGVMGLNLEASELRLIRKFVELGLPFSYKGMDFSVLLFPTGVIIV